MSVFDEPETLTEATVQNADSWLKTAGGEARAVRQVINEWYSNFSDRDTMVLSRLRGDSAVNLFQAIDELHVHKYLSQTCEPVYEEDQNSPDFRLYRSGRYLAGVEVATLFASQDFDNENSRNAELTAVINTQVLSESWLLHYTVVEWHGSPSPKRIAEWAQQKIDALPGPRPDLTAEEYPTAEYRVDGVQLDFTFIPTRPVMFRLSSASAQLL